MQKLLVFLLLSCSAWIAYSSSCEYFLAESIPVGMDLDTPRSTYDAWKDIISSAEEYIDIAQMYFTLSEGAAKWPKEDMGILGKEILDALYSAKIDRNVSIRLLLNQPSASFPDLDAIKLVKEGIVELRTLDIPKILDSPSGIVHTKFVSSDGKNAYVGSANMDWRSLSQVKEMGIQIRNCEELTRDVMKIFDTYWLIGETDSLPKSFPSYLDTYYDLKHPMRLDVNDTKDAETFFSLSPPEFLTKGRTDDLTALLDTLNGATKSISIEVMDYFPTTIYFPKGQNFYWPHIDEALRNAAFRGVSVKFLAGLWNNTNPKMPQYLKSLNELDNIEVQWFTVPKMDQKTQIPFTRVNHAKYAVTDNAVFITTSNWTGDYFINTCGISSNWKNDEHLVNALQALFDRDWNSKYVIPLSQGPALGE